MRQYANSMKLTKFMTDENLELYKCYNILLFEIMHYYTCTCRLKEFNVVFEDIQSKRVAFHDALVKTGNQYRMHDKLMMMMCLYV